MKLISPSRIHMGLIDLNGSIGRVDGGIGITIDYPNFVIEGRGSSQIDIEFNKNILNNFNPQDLKDIENRIYNSSKEILKYMGEEGIYLKINEIMPQHNGLGSGTQISLATGKIISEIYNKKLNAKTISKITGRGGTSGIGVYSFEKGGFIIDGGHSFGKDKNKEKQDFKPSSASKNTPVAPLLFRHDFNWDIVLTIPKGKNICGDKEIDIFKKYCPISLNETQKICHLILMKMMPSIINNDFNSFGEVVNELQYIGFKNIERELQKPAVKELIKNLQKISYSGLSSFGPTIYSLCNGKEDIQKVKEYSNEFFDNNGIEGEIIITKANNTGHKIL
ncbi:beta-ribofuranosylaminobenzene 5'-phosphate synthase [Methanococcus aeolicus]|uniref:beta-ribofuranosylaminobenzene 5'-phosphate synthase n=1 Tax=Methanococcus aeolicus TaxID=42879 RepID=UPI00064F3B97|nr:beta-ribofuranosylaminobenzene 5'-phosphate synthase [Methanococcus aeolicus]UXM85534.1 beta-ribofuranosylaminobenzene 5'-phosphate synthase [Methanococcus aeolicus]